LGRLQNYQIVIVLASAVFAVTYPFTIAVAVKSAKGVSGAEESLLAMAFGTVMHPAK
jgi:hypothetical protein